MTYREYAVKELGLDEDTLVAQECPTDIIDIDEEIAKEFCDRYASCRECWNAEYIQTPSIIDDFNEVFAKIIKLSDDEINEIFGVSGIDVVLNYYTIPQIIEKYNTFINDLQCGDFVKFSYYTERYGYIINIDDEQYDIIDPNGYFCRGIPKVCILEKTGKHSEYFATLHDEVIKHLAEKLD